jgi:NAD(P)-dependent dehydrogenase (short-subunit alcohol dehydrogenase family)
MNTVQELFDLEGKTALVTGGAGHLGSAISRALAESGASVAVASRNLERCRDLASQLGGKSISLRLDIGSEASIRETIDAAAAQLGRLDILVNCAYSGPRPDLETATAGEFDEALHLALTSYFVASQQAARHMRRNGGGSIVQIGSVFGMVGSYPDLFIGTSSNSPPTYHAAKGGLLHLTRYLAVYWAPERIRVNSISPGPFPMLEGLQERAEYYQKVCEKIPMKRFGEAWEIKGAALFLCSDASTYVTGHNLVVDGGWTAW